MGRILFTPHIDLTPPVFPVKYGLLYNWYAGTDSRKITSSDEWIVPGNDEMLSFQTYVGYSGGGNKLKEIGLTYFSIDTGATNIYNFNARGAGGRPYGFESILGYQYIWTTQEWSELTKMVGYVTANNANFWLSDLYPINGASIRPMRQATAEEQLLDDGTYCDNYVGNDGKIYRTVKIGTQVWIASNLAETKFRNGDWIHGFDGGVYTPISNEDWAALTTAAVCAYDDDWNNV